MKMHPSLYTVLLLAVAVVAFRLLLPAEAAPPAVQLWVSGAPEAATGVLTSGAPFSLTFTTSRHYVWVVNDSGSPAYFKVNPAITDTVSPADFQFVLPDNERLFFDNWLAVRSAVVYVSPSAGITMFGW